MKGAGTVTATAGDATVTAANDISVSGTVAAKDGDVTIEAKGGKIEVIGGKALAVADGDAGTSGSVIMTAKTSVDVNADAELKADTAVTMTAQDGAGDITIDGSTVEAKDIVVVNQNGAVSVKNSTVKANGDSNGNIAVYAEGDNGNVTIDTGVTLSAGQNLTIDAAKDVTLNSGATAGAEADAGDAVVIAKDGSVTMKSGTTLAAEKGNVAIDGKSGVAIAEVKASTGSGTVYVKSADGSITDANNDTAANVTAKNAAFDAANGAIGEGANHVETSVDVLAATSMGGVFLTESDGVTVGEVAAISATKVKADGTTETHSTSPVSGLASTDGTVVLVAGGDLTVNGDVSGASLLKAGANVNVNGTVGGGDVTVEAGGGIAFDADGSVSGSDVTLTAESGDITQQNATVAATGGYVEEGKSAVNAAVNASGTATLTAANGSIGTVGSGTADYVGVEGSVIAKAGGDVAVADAVGDGLVVGEGGIEGGKAAAVLTAGSISGDGTIKAPNVTVSAKSFDDDKVPVKVSAGNSLTVNNFRSGMSPLLAVFESDGGNARPELSNLPNKTVVFFDGRLLGGDLQTINTVGSIEAFPVQTPELKSEQGIFGNPTFLHNELDVSNPMAVGAIDFILLEIPRLTLSDDFPLEVERHVAAAGLNPTTTYWFGQSNEESKNEAEGNDGSEPPASGENPDEKGDEGTTPVHTAKN